MAKWRIGDAARSVDDQRVFRRAHASTLLRARLADSAGRRDSRRDRSSAGFTLIELVIVVGVMPLVIGALAVGILSVFSLQSSVSNRLTDSADAQVTSVDFDRDVQSAIFLTTNSSPTNPAQCGTGTPVLGLQLGNSTEITYAAAQNGSSYTLSRNLCTVGGTPPTVTFQSSVVVGRDLPASILNPATPPVSIPQCVQTPPPSIPACVPVGGSPAYETTWVSPLGLTGVNFSISPLNPAPGSKYSYQLTAVPNAAVGSASFPPVSRTPGGGFAVPGTGTYSKSLFFVDFANWNTQTKSTGVSCTVGLAPADGGRDLQHSRHLVLLHECQRHQRRRTTYNESASVIGTGRLRCRCEDRLERHHRGPASNVFLSTRQRGLPG